MKRKRQANFELLRILAMAMVVTLHFLSKGGLLRSFSGDFAFRDYIIWLAEAFCTVAVDVYVLISGYFLVDAQFKLRKAVTLWLQIFLYSAGIPVICILSGIVPRAQMSMDRALTWLFPVLREHYWFATAYLLLYLLSPLLGRAVKAMEQKQLQQTLVLLLLITSVSKSLLPVNLPLDTGGYDILWFICLYLTAAYLRLYGIPAPFRGKRGMAAYAAGAVCIFLLSMGYRAIYLRTGLLGDFYTSPYQYNHMLCLLAAVALFGAFSALRIREGRLSGGILRVASCTFGIYLLHENEALRTLWPSWFGIGADSSVSGLGLAGRLPAAILFWFTLGILAELIRQWVFRKVQEGAGRHQSYGRE